MRRTIPLAAALALALASPAGADAKAGQVDTSFGARGTATVTAATGDAAGGAVKALPDGRVLAGGVADGHLLILRLRRSGRPDGGFGTRGRFSPQLPGTSLDGVRALAVFRDGRIVAAGTLNVNGGPQRLVVVRLLPNGESDPGFGGGLGYVLAGPEGSALGAMTMDRAGAIFLGAGRPAGAGAEAPFVVKLRPDGTAAAAFGGGTIDASAFGAGRVTGLLARPDGTLSLTIGAAPGFSGPAAYTVARLLAGGAPDLGFGGGDGVVSVPMGAGSGDGVGAAALRGGPSGTLLVAGTDSTERGTLRGGVIRLRADGALDRHFGRRGITRVSRSGRDVRISALARDRHGRIVAAGTGKAPGGLVVRLRPNGRRDRAFAHRGITFPVLGHPPGGRPVYTTFAAVDLSGSRPVIAGAAAGPGPLVRRAGGTVYTGRFALTVSRLR